MPRPLEIYQWIFVETVLPDRDTKIDDPELHWRYMRIYERRGTTLLDVAQYGPSAKRKFLVKRKIR